MIIWMFNLGESQEHKYIYMYNILCVALMNINKLLELSCTYNVNMHVGQHELTYYKGVYKGRNLNWHSNIVLCAILSV